MSVFPLSNELLSKMWETLTTNGVGKLLKPWQTRREGGAETDVMADRILRLAQAEKHAESIKKGELILIDKGATKLLSSTLSNKEKISLPPESQDYLEVVTQAALEKNLREEINVAKAIIQAEKELGADPSPAPPESIDADWLHRWRDCVACVSSEEMQNLWGRVLAGELKSPKAYSLRALDFLRNLSQEEASLVEEVGRFIVGKKMIPRTPDIVQCGLTLPMALEMQQIGLLSGVEAMGMQYSWNSVSADAFELSLISQGKALYFRGSDPSKQLRIPAYFVTSLGKQIFSLARPKPLDVFLISVGRMALDLGFEVSLADYKIIPDGGIELFNFEPIQP